MADLLTESGATFSSGRLYRYALWRRWGDGRMAVFVMLNPSTADERDNDPTVERCQRRAARLGLDGLVVANIFAYRSTDPAALYDVADPVGPLNDATLIRICSGMSGLASSHQEVMTGPDPLVVCAWGRHGTLQGRGAAVLAMLRRIGVRPQCLGINDDGTPVHPLYVPYSRPLVDVP